MSSRAPGWVNSRFFPPCVKEIEVETQRYTWKWDIFKAWEKAYIMERQCIKHQDTEKTQVSVGEPTTRWYWVDYSKGVEVEKDLRTVHLGAPFWKHWTCHGIRCMMGIEVPP